MSPTLASVVRHGRAKLYLRRHRVAAGPGAVFFGRAPRLELDGEMRVGSHLLMRGQVVRSQITVAKGALLVIGDHVGINEGLDLTAAQSVEIQSRVRIGVQVIISDTNFHEVAPGEGVRVAPVVLEYNAWIGAGARILPGVRVGRHSVVGAGTVVSRDVPPRSVVVGNPPTIVREFSCADDYFR